MMQVWPVHELLLMPRKPEIRIADCGHRVRIHWANAETPREAVFVGGKSCETCVRQVDLWMRFMRGLSAQPSYTAKVFGE